MICRPYRSYFCRMFSSDEQYMLRCLQLAQKGICGAAPNPLVGAVLVHEGRIIGEGWHERYGEAHAEVNCLRSVKEAAHHLIASATLYVSLEPCAHHGKTPPCSQLIIRHHIPRVVVGCGDPFAAVNGKGIRQLKEAGITVTENILANECREMNKRFFCMQLHKRPYIILKWAQTENGITGTGTEERMLLSCEQANRLVHRWRSEESAIMTGYNTARLDDPKLDNRLWPGRTPIRIVCDAELQLPAGLHLFTDGGKTIIFNKKKNGDEGAVSFVQTNNCGPAELVHELYHAGIQSVLVEGGTKTHNAFIHAGLWDEARIITATGKTAEHGVGAPVLPVTVPGKEEWILNDHIGYYYNTNQD